MNKPDRLEKEDLTDDIVFTEEDEGVADVENEKRRPDPPSRSTRSKSTTPTQQHHAPATPSTAAASSTPSIIDEILDREPPSSFGTTGRDPDEKTTDVEPEINTNSYVDKPPGGNDMGEFHRFHKGHSKTSSLRTTSLTSSPPLFSSSVPRNASPRRLVVNHEHSDSLIFLPPLDIHSPATATATATATTIDAKKVMQQTAMMDEAGSVADSSTGQTQDRSPTLASEASLSKGALPTGKDAALSEEEIALTDATTTPPLLKDDDHDNDNDDNEDSSFDHRTTQTTTTSQSQRSSTTPNDKDQLSMRYQRQPSGAHISEELAESVLADDGPPLDREEEEELTAVQFTNSFSPTETHVDALTPPPSSPPPPKEEEEGTSFIGSFSSGRDRTTHDTTSLSPTAESLEHALSNRGIDATPTHSGQPGGLSPGGISPDKSVVKSPSRKTYEGSTPKKKPSRPQHQQKGRTSITSPANISPNGTQFPSQITYATPKSHSPPLPPQQQQQQHPGRRSITLRLVEEIPSPPQNPLSSPILTTPFRSLRRLSLSSSAFASLNYGRVRSGSDSDTGLAPLHEKIISTPTTANIDGGMTLNNNGANNSGGKKNIGGGEETSTVVDRGTITVSWYEGTTSSEMQEHVFNCVLRKLNSSSSGIISNKDIKRGGKIKLEDVRLLDENVAPHGEVVLCPFLPDGSHFLLKFKTSINRPPAPPKVNHRPSYVSRAPDSPSAEPSPFPSHPNLASLDNTVNGRNNRKGSMRNNRNNVMHHQQQSAQQMQLLNTVAALLQQQQQQQQQHHPGGSKRVLPAVIPPIPLMEQVETVPKEFPTTPRLEAKCDTEGGGTTPVASNGAIGSVSGSAAVKKVASGGATPKMEPIAEDSTTDQLIEQQLRQLNNLFAQRRSVSGVGGTASSSSDGGVSAANDAADGVTMNGTVGGATMSSASNNNEHQPAQQSMLVRAYHREEKRQVIFVIANYLVLFMGCIALSAEIQSRLPGWMQWVQENYDSVQNCSTDREALTECLSNGDFSGLVASFLLWATQSAAAKRIFLFGFDTPKKLWIVVYEALVSAVCWGTSYIFIRRGLNPNTRENFLHKYWKDAVYGSLAGFNAAFMKAVLKNLVPQDVALEALEGGRQLKIFRWLGSMVYDEIIEN
eukprot:CAMPEP_0201624038 /NCGR_PEP_ID=MMETSP0493-20130528/357_1 /ASSEMBLY_ACC=CAM_ASM_000838 /TAXON_ID=420259 /ORGANISM="Thalassiosira gravida, Strain GMp14c1" /LENGTH=1144 /DNA_ID=CAMNT_0048093801 /DNA_START=630 /DNA_END=4064 /DNA_ORIENTATION=+